MRPRYRPPIKRKYFHKKAKIEKKNMVYLKKNIEGIKQRKTKHGLVEKDKKIRWRR